MSAKNPSSTAHSEDSISGPSQTSPKSAGKGGSKGMAIALVAVLVIAGIAGSFYYYEYVYKGKSSSGGGNNNNTTCTSGCGGPTAYTISETGSSLIYPYMQVLGPNFTKLYPNVQISPDSTGSGTGISSAEQGLVDIGGTDAYLDPANASKYGLINVPIAISAQLVYYNLPGVSAHLNLNGTVLAKIYAGAITNWNDPEIQAANPGVTLPSNPIVPLHRSDGSGDTFMFTSLCYMSWNGWTAGYGTSITWPAGQSGYKGNSGMVTGLQSTKYGIAYIGISYESEANAAGLGYAALGDQAANVNGTNPANYILPTPTTISEDANLGLENLQPPSVAVSLILGGVPGATDLKLGQGGTLPSTTYPNPYPDTNLEYTLVKTSPTNAAKQFYVVKFLEWSLQAGGSYTAQVNFLPLTAAVIGYDMEALNSVSVSGPSGLTSFTVSETGSSLIYPYMQVLGPNFTKLYSNVQISPDSTGSGTGISSAEQGLVDIGGTDAYLDPANASKYGLINVPIAISAQLVYYNLPGVSAHLNLNGTVLAKIYAGAITNWNDPEIQAANPGVTLPSNPIVPLHRSDGSGDTFMFTSLCYMSWNGWTAGYGTSITWPAGQSGYKGNSGMVTGLQSTKYGIAYIGISYESEANAAGLGYAALGDQAANVNGTNPANYILPTPTTISEDANLGLENLQPPSVAVSLILGGVPGATDLKLGQGGTLPSAAYPNPYPDTNLEYTLVKTSPTNAAKQFYVVQFLEWCLQAGGSYTAQVNFLPLTAAVIGYDMQALNSVSVGAQS